MRKIILFLFIFIFINKLSAQVELTNAGDKIYDFLQRMQVEEVIPAYNSSNLPLSRGQIADFLKIIDSKKAQLSTNDKKILDFYLIEYNYDITGSMKKNVSLTSDFHAEDMFSNDKYNHIYSYADSSASLFFDLTGGTSFRKSNGDSLGDNSITFIGAGFQTRGTLFNSVGFFLKAVNYAKLSGDSAGKIFAALTDPVIYADWKFNERNENYYTPFEGYLRYQTPSNWLALTIGRTNLKQGFGYIDKLFLSNNTVAFDFAKLDLSYKAVQYSFTYGSLRGDSAGIPNHQLDAKNISTHRLNINFSNRFKLGFFESVIIPNSPFNFTFFNPVSFLTAAELNKASQGPSNNVNNSFLGLDFEIIPVKNVAFQASLLVDDFKWSSLFKSEDVTNKFGYQAGLLWNNAFTLPGLLLKTEYTRLNPFVYSHEQNESQYTHWNLPLGHSLQPNSDEIAVRLDYFYDGKTNANITYRHQRHADGLIDSAGSIVMNYGGNINNGYYIASNQVQFLNGNKINKDIIEFNFNYRPWLQWELRFKYVYTLTNKLFMNQKLIDRYFFVTVDLSI